MKTIFASVLGFGLMTSGAMAEPAKSTAQSRPVVLTSAQMDGVKAGAQQKNRAGNGVIVQVGVNVGDCGVVIGSCPGG
jgi:hypothetical protein